MDSSLVGNVRVSGANVWVRGNKDLLVGLGVEMEMERWLLLLLFALCVKGSLGVGWGIG